MIASPVYLMYFFPEEVMGIAGVPGVVRLASKGATNAKYTHLVMRFQQVPCTVYNIVSNVVRCSGDAITGLSTTSWWTRPPTPTGGRSSPLNRWKY